MTRTFRIKDDSWGECPVFVIHRYEDGTWEKKWDLFRTDEPFKGIGNLFSVVTFEAYQDALRGHSIRLIKELQLPPEGCFSKTGNALLLCRHRDNCSMHDPEDCLADNDPHPPLCFEANAIEDEESTEKNMLMTQVFDMWRKGFYIIIAPMEEEL